jgi:hypothetical protein
MYLWVKNIPPVGENNFLQNCAPSVIGLLWVQIANHLFSFRSPVGGAPIFPWVKSSIIWPILQLGDYYWDMWPIVCIKCRMKILHRQYNLKQASRLICVWCVGWWRAPRVRRVWSALTPTLSSGSPPVMWRWDPALPPPSPSCPTSKSSAHLLVALVPALMLVAMIPPHSGPPPHPVILWSSPCQSFDPYSGLCLVAKILPMTLMHCLKFASTIVLKLLTVLFRL